MIIWHLSCNVAIIELYHWDKRSTMRLAQIHTSTGMRHFAQVSFLARKPERGQPAKRIAWKRPCHWIDCLGQAVPPWF